MAPLVSIEATPSRAAKLRRLLGSQLSQEGEGAQPECLILVHEPRHRDVLARLVQLADEQGVPRVATVVILPEPDRDLRLRALRLGAMEVLDEAQLSAETLEGHLTMALERFAYLHQARRQREPPAQNWNHPLLGALLKAMPAAMVLVDTEFHPIWYNAPAEALFGKAERLIPGSEQGFEVFRADTGEALAPGDWPLARALHTQSAIVNKPIEIGDGERRSLLASASPVFAERGELAGALLIAIDVTESRRAEQELKRSEELVRTIAENSTQGFAMMDARGYCTYANRAWLEMTGYSLAEIIAAPLHYLVHHHYPDGRPYPLEECPLDRALPENFDVRAHEDVFFRKDGSSFPVQCAASPIFKDGLPVSTVIEIRDMTPAKHAEAQLREREQTLTFHVENSPLAVVEWDASLRCTRWTGQAQRIFGWHADEVLRRRLSELELVHPEGGSDLPNLISRLDSGYDRHNVGLTRNRRRDGSIGHFEWYNSARLDADGRLMSILSLVLDVSERHEGELALRQSEARAKEAAAQADAERRMLDAVLEAVPAGIILADAKGHLVRMNPANELLWGPVPQTTSVKDFAQWKGWWADQSARHGQPVAPSEWAMARALAGETVRDDVVEIEPFDRPGTRRTMLNSAAPVKNAEGHIVAGVVAQMDITALIRAEAAHRESELRFRALADNIAQLAWIADQNGRIFWYNRRWTEFIGRAPENMADWNWLSAHHPEHRGRVAEKFEQHIRSGEPWEDTFPLRGRSDQYRWFLSRAVPVRDESGKVVRWFGTNTDITAQREAEEALREADRRKDEFIAILAHELRNPLAPIRSAVQILEKPETAEALLARARNIINRQVSHMARLIDDLLDVSRIARGKLELKKELCDIAAIARQTAEDFRSTLEANGLTLTVVNAAQSLWVEGDPVRIAQMIGNYLQNAARFTDEGGKVEVRIETDLLSGSAVVNVRDTGIGIDPTLLSRLFDPFSQADQGLARTKGGLGLGLTLTKGLAELHGGEVAVDSAGPGKGANFCLRIPLLEQSDPLSVEAEPASSGGAGRRILIIEDNQDAAETLATLLELVGHQVHLAFDGAAGLTAAEQYQPDIIISDIGLPGDLDGYAVAQALRSNPALQRSYLIALSGYADEEARKRSRESGFNLHLAKPTDFAVLERALLLAGV